MTTSIPFSAAIAADLGTMIRRAFGNRHVSKQASRWADCSPHAIREYLSGRREMGAWKLMRLSRHSGFRAELRAYLDRIEREDADLLMHLGTLTQKEVNELADKRLALPGRRSNLAGDEIATDRALDARAGVKR